MHGSCAGEEYELENLVAFMHYTHETARLLHSLASGNGNRDENRATWDVSEWHVFASVGAMIGMGGRTRHFFNIYDREKFSAILGAHGFL